MSNLIIENARKLEGKKVLYFEGAGMDFYEEENFSNSDVGNFRIRTSFLNNDGVQIYLEMGNGCVYDKKGKDIERYSLWIDFCFEVPTDIKEEIQYNKIFNRTKDHLKVRELNYSKEDIVKWINENLNCSFDTIHVLDRFYGYHVHGERVEGQSTYNLMEKIELNHVRAEKRKKAYELAKQYYSPTRKFPCVSVVEMYNNGLKVKCHSSDKELNGLDREMVFTV